MRKQSLKTLVALITFSVFAAHSANAISIPGMGKKQSRNERIAQQLEKADVGAALAMGPDAHVNDDQQMACRTIGRSGKNIATFVGMAAKGCFPPASKHNSINNIVRQFCVNNCAQKECQSDDPDKLIQLCQRYCATANLGSQRAHKLLSQCFSKWRLTRPEDFEDNYLLGWSGAKNVSYPISHAEATAFEGYAKGQIEAKKIESKQSKGEISEYKKLFKGVAKAYGNFIKQRGKLEKELAKTEEAYEELKTKISEAQSAKKELVDAQLDQKILDTEETKLLTSYLPKDNKDETFNVSIDKEGTDKTLAEFVAGLRAAVARVIEMTKEQQEAVDSAWFKKTFQRAKMEHKARLVAQRAKINAEKTEEEEEEKALEEEAEEASKKSSAWQRLKKNKNPMFKAKK